MAAVATLVVAAAVLCGGGSGGPASERVSSGPDLGEEFALFRRAANSRDRLPPQLAPPLAAISRFGLDMGAAKLAYSGVVNRIYAVPGGRAVCLFDTMGVSSTCWPPATVAKGMAVNTSLCPPSLPAHTMQMVGLLPDGIRRAWVVMEDGRRKAAPVTHNLFLLNLLFGRSLPARLIWRRGTEVHNQIAGISPRIARLACARER